MSFPSFAERLREIVSLEIVSLNSISSEEPELDQSNESVIRCLERWLRELGFDVTLIKVKEKPLKYDLLARLGEGDGGLLLSGHTDTVPLTPPRPSQGRNSGSRSTYSRPPMRRLP